MIDFLKSVYEFMLHITQSAPPALWAILVGVTFSALLTQKVKMLFPLQWSQRQRATLTQLVAIVSGFGSVWAVWSTTYGALCGAIAGMLAPTVYYVAVRVIGLRWPQIRDLLSADVREGETK